MFRGRWIEPEWYIATVRRILSVSSLDATAAMGDTELWLFSEGRADEPRLVTLRNGFAGLDLKVRLGSGDVASPDVDLAAARCSSPRTRRSRYFATYSDGVKLISHSSTSTCATRPASRASSTSTRAASSTPTTSSSSAPRRPPRCAPTDTAAGGAEAET